MYIGRFFRNIKWYNLMTDCDKLNMNIINLRETTRKVKETV